VFNLNAKVSVLAI